MTKSELKNIITEVIKQSYEKTKKDNSNKKYQGDPEKGNKILDKANPENVAKILRGEKPVYENINLDSYNNLQKEVLELIMKGSIEIKHYPKFKLSEEENNQLREKGLIPDEIVKLTTGAQFLRFKVNDLDIEKQTGKRFVDIPVTKEVEGKFKDIHSTSKYNDTSVKIYKKPKHTPDERSSD